MIRPVRARRPSLFLSILVDSRVVSADVLPEVSYRVLLWAKHRPATSTQEQVLRAQSSGPDAAPPRQITVAQLLGTSITNSTPCCA